MNAQEVASAIFLDKLTVGYGNHPVLKDVSFEIMRGTVSAIIGANGSGKSTLLKTVSGILPPLSGSVSLRGCPIGWFGRRELARTMAIVYTDRTGSAGGLTVRELVEMGRYPHTRFLGRLDDNDREVVDGAIRALGIEAKADAFLSDISDGERQKAMIARALAQETPIILLDEPTSYLDAASRLDILSLVRTLAVDHGRTVLLSTHDTAPAHAVADNVITIAPSEKPSVAICRVDDPQLPARMNKVFSDRDIIYNPVLRDFEKQPF